MNNSYVGIISQRGLESLIPERGHIVEFLTNRIYRSCRRDADCYWAVIPEKNAEQVHHELACGRYSDALDNLKEYAIDWGTFFPSFPEKTFHIQN